MVYCERCETSLRGAHYAVTTHSGAKSMRVSIGEYQKDGSIKPIKATYGKRADAQDKRLCAAINHK